MEEIMALLKITISCTTSGLKIVGCRGCILYFEERDVCAGVLNQYLQILSRRLNGLLEAVRESKEQRSIPL